MFRLATAREYRRLASILISGPAGGGKTQEALARLGTTTRNSVLADFSSVYNSITGTRRDPATGRFPIRRQADEVVLPLTEQLRRDIIRRARRLGFDVVATNSSGDPQIRRRLLELLGPGATEVVVDPGREVVEERLKVKSTGILGQECQKATSRWYDRINRNRVVDGGR